MTRWRTAVTVAIAAISLGSTAGILWAADTRPGYQAARWDPIHFKPAIEKATDAQCLACHREVLDTQAAPKSPAGVTASETLAWYQTLATYAGAQETFHRRHLVTPLATRLMRMQCTTCHQGNDPREEAPDPAAPAPGFTLRKMVDPKTCLMCHGQFPATFMGLPGPWSQVKDTMGNNCLICHAGIRTSRHQVNFLDPEAIETAGKETADACYGCHGGRAWYRISNPYPRHAWTGMAPTVPDWAKDRPTESDPRFLQRRASGTGAPAAAKKP